MKKRLSILVLASLLLAGFAGAAGGASPDRYTIAFQNETLPADLDAAVAAAGGRVIRRIPQIGVAAVESADPRFAERIARRADMFAVGPTLAVSLSDARLEPFALAPAGLAGPSDLYEQYQWDIKRVTGDGESFRIQAGRRDVVVAVIDSGIDAAHPDLAANVVPGSRSYVEGAPATVDALGHGTHIAGAIAANGRVYGVGPNLGVRSYRVFGDQPLALSTLVQAAVVDAADDGSDVINLSIGGYRDLTDPAQRADAIAYLRAVRYATRRGTTVVAAAGNEGRDLRNPAALARSFELDKGVLVEVPGGLPGLITVSASNRSDQLAFYSNYGRGVIELAAPGGDCGPDYLRTGVCDRAYRVLSTAPGGRWAFGHGTSLAAPKVAGVAALVIAERGRIGPKRVAERLFRAAADIGPKGRDAQFGAGLVQAVPALRAR